MPKRTGGYAVSISAFIPTDPSDLDGQQKVLDAMKALKEGDPGPVLAIAPKKHLKIKSKTEARVLE